MSVWLSPTSTRRAPASRFGSSAGGITSPGRVSVTPSSTTGASLSLRAGSPIARWRDFSWPRRAEARRRGRTHSRSLRTVMATGIVLSGDFSSQGMLSPGEGGSMAEKFKVGDHVTWNSEAGPVSGTIVRVRTKDFDYKGHTHHASRDEPQYEIKSDKTDHVAAHKGSALKKVND